MNATKQRRPSVALSVVIFVVAVAAMAYLRLILFPHTIVVLTYGVPLLICLWHRDRVLLHAMAAAFIAMSSYKAFFLLPSPALDNRLALMQWLMQVANIVIVGGTVHLILNLLERLHERNAELQETVDELAARDEEITRQNEELQSQSEELQQQNEELQQQGEELGQQGEELQAQADELQKKNAELNHRESMLQGTLELLHGSASEESLLQKICATLLELCGRPAMACTVTERKGNDLFVRVHAGGASMVEEHRAFDGSFAAVAMSEGRTAYLSDLAKRPDITTPQSLDKRPKSVLATPLRIGGTLVGTVEVYAATPHEWTSEDFRVIEWVAIQCALVLGTARLNTELLKSREELERVVTERTAKLQELVTELEHFSYTITHDMRAPLRAMRGFAAMLEEEAGDGLNQACKGYVHRIANAAGRMDHLITDALSYSQAVRAKPVIGKVEPEQLLRDMLDSYPEFHALKDHIHVDGKMPAVLASQAGLTQCFSNLLTNALKFVRHGERPNVTVRGAQINGVVRIWVEDEGIGIAPEMMPRMFGMFQRASKAYEGTGIGLALVRKVTERMGGRVGVEPKADKGTRFWIELKAAQ